MAHRSQLSGLLLLVPPGWRYIAQFQCGSCWTSTYCILSWKNRWSVTSAYILMRISFRKKTRISIFLWNVLQLR